MATRLFSLLVLISVLQGVVPDHLKHARVINHLKIMSDPDVIPIPDEETTPVQVHFRQHLVNIVSAKEDREELELIMCQQYNWMDKSLTWDINDRDMDLEFVTLPLKEVWVPDITCPNCMWPPELISPELVTVYSNGTVVYDHHVDLYVYCDLTGLNTSTGASCALYHKSWTYPSTLLELMNPGSSGLTTDYFESTKYKIVSTDVEKITKKRPGHGDNIYDELKFSFTFVKIEI